MLKERRYLKIQVVFLNSINSPVKTNKKNKQTKICIIQIYS